MSGPNVICETGKRTYFEERLANRAVTEAMKRGELPQLKHYQCPTCGYWHLARKYRADADDPQLAPGGEAPGNPVAGS